MSSVLQLARCLAARPLIPEVPGVTLRNFSQTRAAEDIDRLMSYYADDYLHRGITKKQLRFMWLEILSEFSELYSVHIFAKIDVHGGDAILACTGALLGIPLEGGDYQAVDRWVNQNHWLTKVGDQWKIIGGATHEVPSRPGSRTLELHPLF